MKKPLRHLRKQKTKLERSSGRQGQSKTGSDGRGKARFSREVQVLYEDDAVIVLNKPPGLLSVPIKGSDTPSALSLASESLKMKRQRALVVHRIDRFASGILLFAKTNSDRDTLIQQFLGHTPKRQYLAVLRGRLRQEAGKLVHFFQKEGMFQQLRTAKDPRSTRAELDYTVERAYHDATLVRVALVTGLQNQIRAQFAAIGHPL
ncbi:MAG TPA: RNA pseudouridine synthase, partial [Candidatus Sulfotelmatobacter sp.]|nr:RNA pseudouridine synthase [Candidatus Sulfotelmatobacter sp.]